MSAANAITFSGNNTGVYQALGLSLSNKLITGYAVWPEIGTNYSNGPYWLFPRNVASLDGWFATSGEIIDPKKADWRGYQITWIYT